MELIYHVKHARLSYILTAKHTKSSAKSAKLFLLSFWRMPESLF